MLVLQLNTAAAIVGLRTARAVPALRHASDGVPTFAKLDDGRAGPSRPVDPSGIWASCLPYSD